MEQTIRAAPSDPKAVASSTPIRFPNAPLTATCTEPAAWPDALAAAGQASLKRRGIVAEAMRRNDQHWDYTPVFDGTRQYVR